MALPAGLFAVTFSFSINAGAEVSENVFWFHNPTVVSVAELGIETSNVAAALGDAYVAQLQSAISSLAVLQSATGRGHDGDGAPIVAEGAWSGEIAGAAGGTLPYEVAVVCSLRTAIAGRSYRGRSYQGPVGVNAVTASGRLSTTYRDHLGNGISSFLAACNTGGNVPVVWSRTRQVATPITNVVVDDVFDSQRRRQDQLTPVAVSYPV